jgi:predicted transposase/invertase (TIGR01784 family)
VSKLASIQEMMITEWIGLEAMKVWTDGGIEEGREQGIKEGRAKKQREIARNMLRRGTPIESVIEDTGLPLAEIQSMQSQLSQ